MPTPSDLRAALQQHGWYVASVIDSQWIESGEWVPVIRAALAQPSGLRSDDPETPASDLRAGLEQIEQDAGWLHDNVPDYTPDGVATLRDICREIAKEAYLLRAAIGEGSSGSTLDAFPLRGWSLDFFPLEHWLVLTDPGGAARVVAEKVDLEYGGDIARAFYLAARLRVPVAGDREP